MMDVKLSSRERLVLSKLSEAADALGMRLLLAGGFVRDKLLKRPTNDIDVVTEADVDKLAAYLVDKYNLAAPVIGDRSKAVMLTIDQIPIDLMNARRLYSPLVDLEGEEELNAIAYNDSFRRDLTINSMLYDIQEDKLLDFHDGAKDIKNKVIRTIFDPYIKYRTAPEDMLRAVRFASILDGFILHPAVANAIRKHARLLRPRDEGGEVSNRRVRKELRKAFETEISARKALLLLIELGLWPFLEGDIKYATSDRGFQHLWEEAQLEAIKTRAKKEAQLFTSSGNPTDSGGPGGQFTVPSSEGEPGGMAGGGYVNQLMQRKVDFNKEQNRERKKRRLKELLEEKQLKGFAQSA